MHTKFVLTSLGFFCGQHTRTHKLSLGPHGQDNRKKNPKENKIKTPKGFKSGWKKCGYNHWLETEKHEGKLGII